MTQIADRAIGRWDGLLLELAPELAPAIETRKHVPCPVHGGKDGFRMFRDGSGGCVCNTCGIFPSGWKVLEWLRNWDFHKSATEVEKIIGTVQMEKQAPKKDNRTLLDKVARGTVKLLVNDPVMVYLRLRGITQVPLNVRLHPALNYYDEGKLIGKYPAMVSRVQDSEGNRESFHITYLDGSKKADVPSPKKILPPVNTISGCGVYLGEIKDKVMISEGIETGLAAMQMFGLPAIAALSCGGMERIVIPEGVEKVTVLGDNDSNFAGQYSAYKLAKRLIKEGFKKENIEVLISKRNDFLDDLVNLKEKLAINS